MAKSKKHYSLEKRKARMGYVYMAPLLFGLLVLFIPNMISTVHRQSAARIYRCGKLHTGLHGGYPV